MAHSIYYVVEAMDEGSSRLWQKRDMQNLLCEVHESIGNARHNLSRPYRPVYHKMQLDAEMENDVGLSKYVLIFTTRYEVQSIVPGEKGRGYISSFWEYHVVRTLKYLL